ncbi:MAG TPA: UbiA family prenyltransferase [Chitinophagaceae bacterium]|nr:UbiA family prenyltransferase [Chitinophagaceae bacterium]
MSFFRKIFDLFLFSSLFIAICAVIMTFQTNQLLSLDYDHRHYAAFVFFSTICSYNFHWYLTPASCTERTRAHWTRQNKLLHLLLFIAGGIGAAWYFFSFQQVWFWLMVPVILTFLYSAPKLPYGPFRWLKKVAIGKTIFLSMVWLYVTTLAPMLISEQPLQTSFVLFACSRFFLIYAICILFDYRDREEDKKDGIRSMITYFSEQGITILFYGSLAAFAAATAALYLYGVSWYVVLALLLPGLIVMALFNTAKRNFSDYLYYFVLDGLMMFSALFTLFW